MVTAMEIFVKLRRKLFGLSQAERMQERSDADARWLQTEEGREYVRRESTRDATREADQAAWGRFLADKPES